MLSTYPSPFRSRLRYYPEETGSTDPLAGVTFHARWQSHSGNNAPLGIFSDDGATVPAVEFDPVLAWRDAYTLGNPVANQSDVDKGPVLSFTDEVPWLEFDGAGDVLVSAVSVTQPCLISAVVQVVTTGDFIGNAPNGASCGVTGGDNLSLYAGVELNEPSGTVGWKLYQARLDGASSEIWVNNVSVVSGNAGLLDFGGGMVLGAYNQFGAGSFPGGLAAVLVTAEFEARTIIHDYLASIYSPLL